MEIFILSFIISYLIYECIFTMLCHFIIDVVQWHASLSELISKHQI